MSKTISKLSNGGKGLPCCGLASLAMVTNTPLPIIYRHYQSKYNKPKQWRGATNFWNIKVMMAQYGLVYKAVSRKDMEAGRTLANFIKDNPTFYGIVRTKGHLQVVMASSVYDQGGIKDISIHFGRNKYICDYAQITGQENISTNMDYRYLLLITDGVCSTMEEARKLYETYGKVVLI